MAKLIGVTGLAGSGKSTIASMLVEEHGYTLVKFAAPLKDMLRSLGLTEREIEGDLKEKPCALLHGRTPRYAMQTLGTEWGRNIIGSNLWVSAAMARVGDIIAGGGKVVMDDVRFPNEAESIQRAGGQVVMVVRPNAAPVEAHASEDQELWFGYGLLNTDGLPELRDRVRGLIVAMEG